MNETRNGSRNGANPFVGPRPFGKTDPIYGRDREVRQLRDLLISQRIVVFYSPSGAGKTSLIEANAAAPLPVEPGGDAANPAHAGLRWEMERARFRVLPVIRVNRMPTRKPRADVNRYALSALLSLEENHPRGKPRRVAELAGLTLAQYLAEWPPAEDAPTNDVLIFDQFEELLTLDPTDRVAKEEFLTQVREVLRDGDRWALFSLREDHLGGLDPYAAEIPTQLAAAFRLDLLDRDAAKQAMQNPAVRTGVEFSEEAAQKLLDDLGRVRVPSPDGSSEERPGPYVEPVHLQVVCRRLWEEAAARDRRIDPALVAEVGAVDDALRHFYAAAVAAVVAETGVAERTIRSWFDEQLITGNGIRSQVIQEEAEAAGLPKRVVDALVDRHLVRREPRRGVPWLELAHDRLIAPIRADNNDWYRHNLNSVQQAAKAWDNGGRQLGFLLTGDALALAEAWAAEQATNLTDLERAFLDASRQQRDQLALEETKKALAATTLLSEQREARLGAEEALRREAEQRAAEQTKATHKFSRLARVALLLLVGALILAVVAWFQRQYAESQRELAEAKAMEVAALELTSRSRLLAKQAEDEPDRAAAMLLAAEALQVGDTAGARQAMLGLFGLAPTSPLVWERPVAAMDGGEGKIRGLAFSPDSKTFVAVNDDGSLSLWSAAVGVPARPRAMAAVLGTPRRIAFANDNLTIATAGSQGVQLWNARTLQAQVPADQTQEAPAPPDEAGDGQARVSTSDATSVAFNPSSGRELVYGEINGQVMHYAIDGAQTTVLPQTRLGGVSRINSVAYSSRGSIAAGREDGKIALWQTRPETDLQLDPTLLDPDQQLIDRGHGDLVGTAVTSLAFNPAGTVLAVGHSNGAVTRWEVTQQQLIGYPLLGGDGAIENLAFSPDGHIIAAADRAGAVALWKAAFQGAGQVAELPVETLALDPPLAQWGVAFSPDGAFLASGGDAGEIRLWSRVGQPLTAGPLTNVGITSVAAVDFSDDGRQLAAGGAAGIVRLCATTIPLDCDTLAVGQGHVRSLAFAPHGDRLAWGDYAGSVTIYPLSEAQAPEHLETGSIVEALVFRPDGGTLIAGLADGSLLLWDLHVDTPEGVRRSRQAEVTALAANPVSPEVASYDREAAVWVVAPDELRGPRALPAVPSQNAETLLARRLGRVRSLAFDPTGSRLAAAGGDMVLWDAESGEVILQDHPLARDAQRIAFAPDGVQLASGSRRGNIMLWDITRGAGWIGELGQLPAAIIGLGWTDAATLIAVDVEGSVLILQIDLAAWQEVACHAASRPFTPDEQQRYLGEEAPSACTEHLAVNASPVASGTTGG